MILLDGCTDSAPGKILSEVLGHMAGIVGSFRVDKRPGHVDMEGYSIVRDLVKKSFNSKRGQVEIEALVGNLVNNPFVRSKPSGAKVIVLIPEDLYAYNRGQPTNWVHGSYFNHYAREVVVISAARFYSGNVFDPIHFKHVMAHELGHMYNATSRGRRHTYESLGTHCANDCIMQQDLEVRSGKERAHDLHRRGVTFCNNCKREMVRLHRRP
jgi:predicted Zn-dependent protease